MVGSVDEGRLHPDHRESGQHASFSTFFESLFHSGEIVARYGTAEDGFGKDQFVPFARLKLNPDVSELSVPSRLLFMPALYLDLFADGFTVGHLRNRQGDVHAEFALELGDDHIQMLLAESGQNLLLGFGIGRIRDGGILFHQAV